MDNQHKLIKGYRDLTKTEIDLMNRVKAKAIEVADLIKEIRGHLIHQEDEAYGDDFSAVLSAEQERLSEAEPQYWLTTATQDLQVGFMKLVRTVAQPTTF